MVRNRRKKGFTLVEIMIVVLIIGILMAIAVPNFITARTNSRLQSAISNLKQIDTAKEQFAMSQGLVAGATVNDATDLCPTYMKAWPSGPVTGTYTANTVGADPTFNSMTADQLTAACAPSGTGCPF